MGGEGIGRWEIEKGGCGIIHSRGKKWMLKMKKTKTNKNNLIADWKGIALQKLPEL